MSPTNPMDIRQPRTKLQELGIVLVTGVTGQLGYDLIKLLSKDYQIIPASRVNFDITNPKMTMDFIEDAEPDVIIHAAAFTDVDACESQQDKAFAVNGLGARNVAIAAREVDAKLFYISTDYVFDGAKTEPYREYDHPNPQTIYGKSKLMGQEFVGEQLSRFFIIRIAWLYGQNGHNFVKTMLNLAREKEEIKVVDDQRGSPTWTMDIARQIRKLLSTEAYGTYHCTSQGSCTWYEFALEIFKYAGYEAEVDPNGSAYLVPKTQDLRTKNQDLTPGTQNLRPITVKPVTSEEFPRPAKRPTNSVLENYMLQLQHLDTMLPWKESLGKFMRSIDSQQSTVSSQQPKGWNHGQDRQT